MKVKPLHFLGIYFLDQVHLPILDHPPPSHLPQWTPNLKLVGYGHFTTVHSVTLRMCDCVLFLFNKSMTFQVSIR